MLRRSGCLGCWVVLVALAGCPGDDSASNVLDDDSTAPPRSEDAVAYSIDPSARKMEIRKYEGAGGSLLWAASIPDAFAGSALLERDGNVTAWTKGCCAAVDVMRVHRIDGKTGALAWSASQPSVSWPPQILVHANQDLTVSSLDAENRSWLVRRYGAQDGTIVWSISDSSGGGRIALDGNQDVLVSTSDMFLGVPVTVSKYAGSTGARIWSTTLAGDDAELLPDAEGNVTVHAASGVDTRVSKLQGTSGAILWSASHPNAGVAVLDPGRNVITWGTAPRSRSTTLRKYAADSGALIWSATQPGLRNSLHIDSKEDVIAHTSDSDLAEPVKVRKYDRVSGEPLWSLSLTGYGGSVLDPRSNLLLFTFDDSWTFTIRKYDGLTGTLRWTASQPGAFGSVLVDR